MPLARPTSIPKRTPVRSHAGSQAFQLYSLQGYVGAVLHALEVDLLDRGVGPRPRLDDRRSGADHVQDAPPGREERPAFFLLGGRVVDVDAGRDVVEARDLVPRVGRVRVPLRGEHDADRLVRRPDDLAAGQV